MLTISILALVFAALFTGAAGYITLVEHPARLGLEDAPLLAQWQSSYSRALAIQSGLVIAGGVASIGALYLSGNLLWAFGSLVLLANWPFTLLAIMPTNRQLKAVRPCDAGPMTRVLMLSWGRLHNVRTVLGAVAMVIFGWAIVTTA